MKDYELATLKEKSDIINESLSIINELADNDSADRDGDDTNIEFVRFIMKARKLKNDRWFPELLTK